MKKILMLITLALVALMTWSCSDDDNKPVAMSYGMLPQAARQFVTNYFPGDEAVKVYREGDYPGANFEVVLKSGFDIEFDATGAWIDVDAPGVMPVPAGIIPTPITLFVENNYPTASINEITKNTNGYEADLTNGVDLQFNADGGYIGLTD